MKLILLVVILILKILITKAGSLGIFLFLFWLKGRQLQFASDEWDKFFLTLPDATVKKYAVGIYLTSSSVASVITFFVLQIAGYQHSVELAILFFVGSLVVTACRWHKTKEYILRRWQEIPKTILERRENTDNK